MRELAVVQESSSEDEFDARGNPKPKKVKKRTKVDDMKDELTDLLGQIDIATDSYDRSQLKKEYERALEDGAFDSDYGEEDE